MEVVLKDSAYFGVKDLFISLLWINYFEEAVCGINV